MFDLTVIALGLIAGLVVEVNYRRSMARIAVLELSLALGSR